MSVIVPNMITSIGRRESDQRKVVFIHGLGYYILPHPVTIEKLRSGRDKFDVLCRQHENRPLRFSVNVGDIAGLRVALRKCIKILHLEQFLLKIPMRRSWWFNPVLGPDIDGRYQVRIPKVAAIGGVTRIHVGYAKDVYSHSHLRDEAEQIHLNVRKSIKDKYGLTMANADRLYTKNPINYK